MATEVMDKPAALEVAFRSEGPAHGFRPLEYYVAIRPDELEKKTPGGIIIPVKSEDEVASQRGVLVAMSPLAFNFAEGGDHKPAVGDTVLYGRYAGTLQKGADGKEYRLLRDRDVIAVLECSR